MASQAISEVRTIARNLRPYQLDRLGLTMAIESIVSGVSTSSNIEFSSEIDSIDNLSGVASPAALTQAIGVNPQVIGSASGLYGFSQMGVGAICTALVGMGTDPALTTAVILVGAGIIGQASFWLALARVR